MATIKPFAYPPLKEVAFELTFKPKMKVHSLLPEFQDKISDQYPMIAEEISSNQILGYPERAPSKFLQKMRFDNQEHTRTLRISISSFNYIERSYVSFSEFSEELLTRWGQFKKEIGSFAINRIGLRYINQLTIPIDSKNWKIEDFTKPYFDTSRFDFRELRKIYMEARIATNDKYLNIRSGVIGTEFKKTGSDFLYELDYDCFQKGENLSEDIEKTLIDLHDKIENQFLNDVQTKYKQFMKTGEWK